MLAELSAGTEEQQEVCSCYTAVFRNAGPALAERTETLSIVDSFPWDRVNHK